MTETVDARPPIPRDRYGRPMVVPPGGGKPVPYTRATTVAETLDDRYRLEKWKTRQTAIGLSTRPDLLAMVAVNRGDKAALDQIVQDALDASESSAAANLGTAMHAATEAYDRGQPITDLPGELRPDLAAYVERTKGIEMLHIEQFCVHDGYAIGGTPDRVMRMPDGRVVIGDVKTGAGAVQWGQTAIAVQLAIYANSVGYDHVAQERFDLPADLSLTTAVVIHLPIGTGTCDLYEVDIEAGREAVRHSLWARDWRRRQNLFSPLQAPPPRPMKEQIIEAALSTPAKETLLETSICNAQSAEVLTAIWEANRGAWTPKHTALAKARKQELEAAL